MMLPSVSALGARRLFAVVGVLLCEMGGGGDNYRDLCINKRGSFRDDWMGGCCQYEKLRQAEAALSHDIYVRNCYDANEVFLYARIKGRHCRHFTLTRVQSSCICDQVLGFSN
jgi:hypothetical protein